MRNERRTSGSGRGVRKPLDESRGLAPDAHLYIPPPSRKWEDFPPRLQLLADATGLTLQLPEEAEGLLVGDRDRAHCHNEIDARIDELVALARESRISEADPDPDEDVPF